MKLHNVKVTGASSVGNFFSHFCEALLGPILPGEAELKEITTLQYGLILGIVNTGVIVFAPIFGHTISDIPPPFTLHAGLFVTAITTALIGVLQYSPGGSSFFATALVARTILGIGVAAVQTSSIAIITQSFPQKTGRAFAVIRVIGIWGGLVSPVISTYLYQVGGFGLPFFVSGGLTFVAAVFAAAVYPRSEYVSHSTRISSKKFIKFWFNKNTAIHSIMVMKAVTYYTFNHSILEPNLRQFKITPVAVGAVYAFTNFVNSFSNPVWGCLLDKMVHKKTMYLVTSCFTLLFFLFAGPLPYFTWSQELWLFIIMQISLAAGTSGTYVCAYSCTISDALSYGFPDDISTYGLASSVYTTVTAFGGFLGSVLGGYLLGKTSFQHATAIFFYIELGILAMTFVYLVFDCRDRFAALGERRGLMISTQSISTKVSQEEKSEQSREEQ